MVYLHFPSKFTEEEIMLQTKYQKLKRKKKALLKQKAPRTEPERSPVKISKGPKIEARDAREVAKKLLKSGAISPIVKTPKRPENEGFKRPARFRGLDRKPIEEKTVPSYQPFSSSPADEIDDVKKPLTFTPKVKNLYDTFVSERLLVKPENEKYEFDRETKSKQGNTIFVSGYKVNEEFLRRTFSKYGSIVDVSVETGKERGFVTFKKSESAETAIREMDNEKIAGTHLKVSMAKKQPMNPSNEAVPNEDWGYIANNFHQKGSYNDKREPVDYDDL